MFPFSSYFSVTGALGALGSRYGSKAMKNGSMFNFFAHCVVLHFINLRQVMFVFCFFNFFQILVGRYPGAQLGVGKLSSE